DRLVMSIPESAESVLRKPDAYIAPLGDGMNKEAARLARELRKHDLVIELGDETFRLKKSLETASKIGARFAIILGENEANSGQFAVKNLEKGEQVTLSRTDLVQHLQQTIS
ncbi:MAG TPA: His/Gly/Thr/Pro-type tRNA ligase C-terminal domain-containing protein, partial [Terriglobales bacterium]|nr:His/Gly/Thr/Pro-type tRNA ligase C-terminal domain-containing protein [Terriglobales bacterium]